MSEPSEGVATRLSLVESQLRQGLTALADLIDGQRQDIGALATALAETRADVQRMAASQQEAAEAGREVDRRLAEVAAEAGPGVRASIVERLRERMDAVEVRLTELVNAREAALRESVERALAQAEAGANGRDQELGRAISRLVNMVAAVRDDVEETVAAAVRGSTAKIADEHAELERRVDMLGDSMAIGDAKRSDDGEERAEVWSELQRLSEMYEELAAALQAGDGASQEALNTRLEVVRTEAAEREHQVQHAMSRLSAMVAALRTDLETSIEAAVRFETAALEQAQDAQWGAQAELKRVLEDLAASVQAGEARLHALEERVHKALTLLAEGMEPSPPSRLAVAASANTLLEDLERQLEAAEGRLAQRAEIRREFPRRTRREDLFDQEGRDGRPLSRS